MEYTTDVRQERVVQTEAYRRCQRIKKIRPLWHIDYPKEAVKTFLSKEFGWKWYGGHHLENPCRLF